MVDGVGAAAASESLPSCKESSPVVGASSFDNSSKLVYK